VILIGLTGGIASGKSVVGRRLAELGAVHVDADVLAREVVESGQPALAEIEREFGASVISRDGSLNRPALGAIIFSDADSRAALNAITHPAIWKRATDLFEAAQNTDPTSIVVYDVPLLIEASGDRPMSFDTIVVTHADAETRIERMMSERGLTREDAEHRLGSQATDDQRLAVADVVIDTNGTMQHTLDQVDALWASLTAKAPNDVGGAA
jgi:dephospho-CoA kinase